MVEVERFINSRFNSNTYIIAHPEHDNVWIVDPGDTDDVFEWMRVHSKTTVTEVLLTHSHFDHMYGINEVISRFPSVKVYVANEYGKEALSDAKKNGSKYTEEGPIVIKDNSRIVFYSKEVVLWDDERINVLYTPGHSDDSVCLYVGRMLFTGDTLIEDVRTVTKLKTGSVEKLSETVSPLKKLQGNGLYIYPGHGNPFEMDKYNLQRMLLRKGDD